MVAFLNDRFIEDDKAALGVTDLSIQRGYAIFDFLRVSNYVPLYFDDHLSRFFNSADKLGLQPLHTREQIKQVVAEMIRQNDMPAAGIKIILTGGYSPDGFEPAASNLIIVQQAVQLPGREKFEKGIKIILHEYLRDLPYIKSTNYLLAVYLRTALLQQGADDVLYYKNNAISEFPRSNVFIVTNEGTVVTPRENVLHGITRMKLLGLAAKKYKVEERAVSVEELKNAAEVFLTSTTKLVMPVLSIDDKITGNGRPGEITKSLYHSLLQAEEAFVNSFSWS